LYDPQFTDSAAEARAVSITQNSTEAVKWYTRAAKQGHVAAQYRLGLKYSFGIGVLKDDVEALAWLSIAAATGDVSAAIARRKVEQEAGRGASLAAQQRAKQLLAEIEMERHPAAAAGTRESAVIALPADGVPTASGTGAIVTRAGCILTAAHVVATARNVRVLTSQGIKAAEVLRIDENNDIALLKLSAGTYPALPVAQSRKMRLGQMVATIGFPNIQLQGFSPKVTRGEISSLNGLGDDPRAWQISVPVQAGNSGGPLLDEYGNLVGIVVAKLGMKAANITGDLPQNVNYAVKSDYALALLEPYSGNGEAEPIHRPADVRFEDMVARAQQSVVLILVY